MVHDSFHTNTRKNDHIRIVLEEMVDDNLHVFDKYRLPYCALPDVDMQQIDTSCDFLGKKLSFPFLLSSMTGWPAGASTINMHLARAAQAQGVALGLWSMRVVLQDPSSFSSFDVRDICPDVPLFANIGLVQLNYWVGADDINRLVDMTRADGIFLHINAMQEAVQPEWDTNFSWLLDRLAKILPYIQSHVIVKEVWNGLDAKTIESISRLGVSWFDVSWQWWTSWPAVEWYRRQDALGEVVRSLWIPTDVCLTQAKVIPNVHLIAGWGVRSWIDILKAQTLWAKMATAAGPFLSAALESQSAVESLLMQRRHQYKIWLFSMNLKKWDGSVSL